MKFRAATLLAALALVMAIPGGRLLLAQPSGVIAQITEIKDRVDIKRIGQQKWESFRPTQVRGGIYLSRGDLVRVPRDGSAVVQCRANETRWTVPNDGLPRSATYACPVPRT